VRVLVGLPTFNNGASGYTIRRTLGALANQSYRDFRVLVVYKPSPGDGTLDVVDEFRDKLDIEVRIQGDGFFEEALNEIFKAATDYDITLTTDDDAIPTKTWIQEHIQFHKNHEKIGIISGITSQGGCYDPYRIIRQVLGYYKPLINELINYYAIINDIGLWACNPKYLDAIKNYGWIYSLDIGGNNMSFKSGSLIDGFALPGYTKRGGHYERILALYFIRQRLHSAKFNGGFVKHLERDSLSRPKTETSKFMVDLENYLLPYGVYYYGFKINLDKLKLYKQLVKFLQYIEGRIKLLQGYVVGLSLAIEAIENKYKPSEVRRRLLEIEQYIEMKYK